VIFLEGYFDETGAHSASHLALGGFVAEQDHWKRFAREWEKALKDQGVPFFKAQWFEKKKKFFRSWGNEGRRRAGFLNRLLNVIEDASPQPIGGIVPLGDYNDIVKPGRVRSKVGSAYTVCAAQCFIDAGTWAKRLGHVDPVSYVFDCGHPNRGEFEIAHKTTWNNPTDRGRFLLGPLAFSDEQTAIPLQAADLIAYELARYVGGERDRDTFSRIRKLNTDQGLFSIIDRDALIALVEKYSTT
jgi:hypothetical protein